MGYQSKHVTIDATNQSVICITQPCGILRNSIQHRLNIGRRAGDHAQDFTRRRLLFQRLGEFLEQPHVLDGDHGLVGEGLQKLDLRRGKGRTSCDARQCTNEFRPADEGERPRRCASAAESLLSGNRSAARTSGMWSVPCSRIQRYCGSSILISTRPDRAWNQNEPATTMTVPLAESQHQIINPTNPRRALDDRIEDRLHVRRRAADDAEHLGRCRLMLQRLAQFCVALLQFFEQPHVLDGDHGLVGKGFEQAICFSVNGRTSVRRMQIDPMETPSRSNGATSAVRTPMTLRSLRQLEIIPARRKVMNMNVCRSRMARPTGTEARVEWVDHDAATGIDP